MASSTEDRDTPATIEDQFDFQKSSMFLATPGQSEVEALRAEVEQLRELNDRNVHNASILKDKLKVYLSGSMSHIHWLLFSA